MVFILIGVIKILQNKLNKTIYNSFFIDPVFIADQTPFSSTSVSIKHFVRPSASIQEISEMNNSRYGFY